MARERNAIASVTKFSASLHWLNRPLLSMQIFQNQAYTAVFTHHCTAYMTCFLHKWRKVADILYCCQDTDTYSETLCCCCCCCCSEMLWLPTLQCHTRAVPSCLHLRSCFSMALDLLFFSAAVSICIWKVKKNAKNRTWPFLLGRNIVLLRIWYAGWVTPICLMQPQTSNTSCFFS